MKDFFKNNNNLIKADLKNLSMEGVVSMESTFSRCSNLYEVDLEDVISQNLISINNLFEKCKKLIKVNLSMKNISELLESNNCFIDCENLKFINLSSFHKINNKMFLGIKSNPTIQANELIYNDLYYIFHFNLNKTVNITITTNNSNNECVRGNDKKCKDCSIIFKKNCATCNKGYYLASDSENKTFCENCNKIKECVECYGNLKNLICMKCKEGFKLENNLCIEETCELGIEDKCKTCKNDIGRKKECDSCNDGYYLEENKISFKCMKCSIKNCKKCSVYSGYEICHECKDNFILIKDDNEISYSCICPTYYKLINNNNTCKKTGNWVEAEYNIDIDISEDSIHYYFCIVYILE